MVAKPGSMGWKFLKALSVNLINILLAGTLIVGTTGAGKTWAFDLLVTQAVWRGEAVTIIDPKGDKDSWLRRSGRVNWRAS